MDYDYVIIGGGIVGISTAWQLLQKQPGKRVLLIEKEDAFGQHQTGHNSGVIHAGIYYAPGSLKARFCREGAEATMRFCDDNGIAYEQCGKLIVATNEREQRQMLELYERGRENQLELELLNAGQLEKLEPNVVGLGAILVNTTGIVDYVEICEKMVERFHDLGGETRLGAAAVDIDETPELVTISLSDGTEVTSGFLIACTGLGADRLARKQGISVDFQIVPYRGEYYQLPSSKRETVQHLIYPVPNPEVPFLGVHLTRMIDGSVTVGPNAVQGWKREGYGRINISFRDCWEMLTFPGYWRVTATHLKTGLREFRDSIFKRGYLRAVQKYCPSIQLSDLTPYPAGIRAQAVMRDGTLVHDFLFAESQRSLHVCNAPSPAATSAIPIGNYICEKVLKSLHGARPWRTRH